MTTVARTSRRSGRRSVLAGRRALRGESLRRHARRGRALRRHALRRPVTGGPAGAPWRLPGGPGCAGGQGAPGGPPGPGLCGSCRRAPGPCGAGGTTASGPGEPCAASSPSGPGAEGARDRSLPGVPIARSSLPSLTSATGPAPGRDRVTRVPHGPGRPWAGPSATPPGSLRSVAGAPVTTAGPAEHDRPGRRGVAPSGEVLTDARRSAHDRTGREPGGLPRRSASASCAAPTTPPTASDGHSGHTPPWFHTPAELGTRSRGGPCGRS